MTVIIQVKDLSELEGITQWLSERKIVIQKVIPQKIEAKTLLKRLHRYRVQLPEGYIFNREEANER